jgi:hypothetical protein
MNSKWQFFLQSLKKKYLCSNKIEVGKQSTFDCAGDLLQTRIAIQGVNNRLEISEGTRICNYDIAIKGSGNSLEVENDCFADGNHVGLTMRSEGD